MRSRNIRRRRERELSRINLEFWSLVRGFEESLFAYDWDSSEELRGFPIFEKYNEIWFRFCNNWKQNSESYILDPDPEAFYRYAIDREPGKTVNDEEREEDLDETVGRG